MKKKTELIKITSDSALVEGDVHYGTYVRTEAGHADKAVRVVARFEELAEELSRKEGGTTSSIRLKENNKRVMGDETIGFTLEVTDTKKNKKALPLAPDSPLAPPAKLNSEHFSIAEEDSHYRVDISYASFGDTEAEAVVATIEKFIEGKGRHNFVKASCVRKSNGDIKSLKFNEKTDAAKLIQLLNEGLAEIPMYQRFDK